MLLSFSVENFRSFRDEQTLSLFASKRLNGTGKPPHLVPVPGTGEDALRVVSLYGANGAGKSNLVRAIEHLKTLVCSGTAPDDGMLFEPFLLDDESGKKPVCLDVQFIEDGRIFRYGTAHDSKRVHEEWLSTFDGKKEREVFSRTTDADNSVTVELGDAWLDKGAPRKLKALAEVGARPNQLFLTEVINLNDPQTQGSHFEKVIRWFRSTLTIIRPNARFALLHEWLVENKEFASFAGRVLREASTGIADLEVEVKELPVSEFSFEGDDERSSFMKDLSTARSLVLHTNDGGEINVKAGSQETVKAQKLLALHDAAKGKHVRFPFHQESDGSQRLLNLLPALHQLATKGGVYVVDELERSMHPMLARKFIEFFLKAASRAASQIVFTTHESTLLDQELMRRDGIWFAEKNTLGATHLYSLVDFKVRKDLRIEKGYLEGRFGAIPFLGGIDNLIEEQTSVEEAP